MSERRRDGSAQVGVRELRQNLSVYLDRVKRGESLEVTEHGRLVARLAPPVSSRLDELVTNGQATPASANLRALPPPVSVDGPSVSSLLQRMRDEERS